MQTNARTKCAVGAMLFGGTLGGVQGASANITFDLNGPNFIGANYESTYNSVYTSFLNTGSFAAAQHSRTGINGLNMDFSWSETTSAGFAMNKSGAGILSEGSPMEVRRAFTVTGSQEVQISWSGGSAGTEVYLGRVDGGGWGAISALTAVGWSEVPTLIFPDPSPNLISYLEANSGSYTLTLGAGQYYVWGVVRLENPGDVSFNFSVVPAPGAIALLGAAGLVGSRRRRA